MTKLSEFVQSYIELHPDAAAIAIESTNKESSLAYLLELTDSELSTLVPHLSSHLTSVLLEQLPADRAAIILHKVPDSTCVLALRHLLPEKRSSILAALHSDRLERINLLLSFADETAASIMDNTIAPLYSSDTVGHCMKLLKSSAYKSIYYLYLVDADYKLCGVMNLKELLNHSDSKQEPLSSFMTGEVFSVAADMTLEALQQDPSWFDYHALPVTDRHGRYLGVIRYETIKNYELTSKRSRSSSGLLQTGNALGELYSVGVVALLGAASSIGTKKLE